MRLLLPLLLFCTSCVRLSDPVYVFKPLNVPEVAEPGYALVFGTVVTEGGFLPTGLDAISIRQVAPKTERPYHFATEETLFRVFTPRYMKDGHFVLMLRPGAYELVELYTRGFFSGSTRWKVGDEAALASRFNITRPGIYDLGTLKIRSGFLNQGTLEQTPAKNSPEREKLRREAVAGTGWEKYLGTLANDTL